MANESSKKVPSHSPSLSPSPSPSPSPSSSVDSYIGSLISLTSKFEIRYEGVLYYLNPQDCTLGLKNVRSYGTEGRKKDGPQLPPSDKLYEFILFRGSDIKDLQVKSSPPSQKEEPVCNDPAIIQSQYAVGPSISSKSVSVGGGSLTGLSSYQEPPPPSLTSRAYPGSSPPYQSGAQLGTLGPMQTTQNVSAVSFTTPLYWQDGTSGSISYASRNPTPMVPMCASSTSLPPAAQNLFQDPTTQVSTTVEITNSSYDVTPSALTTCNSVNLNTTPILTPDQRSTIHVDMPSSLSVKASPSSSHTSLLTANRLTMPSFHSSCQVMNTTEAPIVNKSGSDPVMVLHARSLPCSGPSVADSTSGHLSRLSPTLLTPDQLAQSKHPPLSSTDKPYSDQKNMSALYSASPSFSSSMTIPAGQVPLLPLPLSAREYSMPQFTEEFDFEAMNEKFKKDEVWGYFGHAKQGEEAHGVEDSAVAQNSRAERVHGNMPKFYSKPAYAKDDFFDTISCNSLARGARNAQNRFSERMKADTETFGSFQRRPHLGYNVYGAARGGSYQGLYNWGRGYYHRGRGRGGNWHI